MSNYHLKIECTVSKTEDTGVERVLQTTTVNQRDLTDADCMKLQAKLVPGVFGAFIEMGREHLAAKVAAAPGAVKR